MKSRLTPWTVGLALLVLATVGSILAGVGKRGAPRRSPRPVDPGRATAGAAAPSIAAPTRPDSYNSIVTSIRPSVVGIRLPGARPFVQAWTAPAAGFPCPRCGCPRTWNNTPCPRCGLLAAGAGGGAPAQTSPAALAAPSAPAGQREEFLECPNCRIRITPTPGIPWAGATCPNCKTQLAHVIREAAASAAASVVAAVPPVGQAVLNPFGVPALPDAAGPQLPDPRSWIQGFAQGMPQAQAQLPAGGIGAGIIVSRQGYILTNAHLLEGQAQAEVTLFNAQRQAAVPGVVVASRPDLDLAVLKIDAAGGLTPSPLGDSDRTAVGDTVLAFGNPFGLSQSVTGGIISAKRQSISIGGLQLNGLLQTDAPINEGSSGGPLVDTRGRVIGLNTAIYSPMQTNTGLGFAIPINQARLAFPEYIDAAVQGAPMAYRCPVGGAAYPVAAAAAAPEPAPAPQAPPEEAPTWIGVEFQMINDVLAEQLKLPFDRGLLVNNIFPNSPAAASGLERGDAIYRADGRRINDETQIRLLLADKKPGDTITFSVFRQGKKVDITIELAGGAYRKAAIITPSPDGLLAGAEIEAGTADITTLGLTIDKITPEVAFAFNLPEGTQGVVISAVEGLSMSQGVKPGDVIASIDGRPTPDLLALFKAMKKRNTVKGVDMGLMRDGKELHVFLRDNPPDPPMGV